MLGKLTIRYGKEQWTTRFEGNVSTEPYRVVWSSAKEVFLVSGEKEKQTGRLLYFESPSRYTIQAGRFVEYFSKVRTRRKRRK